MEVAYLKEFLAMSELCNYTAAAETMFVSQPTLYRHIKTLETELGVPLFERHGKKIVLSRFGEQLVPHARRVVDEMEEYSKKLASELNGGSTTLSVTSNYYINDLVCNFFEENHKYKILVVPDELAEGWIELTDHELAVAAGPAPPDELYECIKYCEDEVVAVMSASHPLARRRSVRIDELRDEDFIVIYSSTGNYITPSFRFAGVYNHFQPKAVMQVQYGSQAAQMAAQGFGVTLLFRRTIERADIDNLAMIPLNPPARFPVHLYWRRDSRLSEGAEKLIEFVKKQEIIT